MPELAINDKDVEIELQPATRARSLGRQHSRASTRFYAITSDGIDIFAHLRPVELYRRVLEKFGADSRQMATFVEMHGPLELCIMALIVIATDTSPEGILKVRNLRQSKNSYFIICVFFRRPLCACSSPMAASRCSLQPPKRRQPPAPTRRPFSATQARSL